MSDHPPEDEADQAPPSDADPEGAGGADDVDHDELEAERRERLDPDNRPDDVEVDNTRRDFDAQKGMFTDDDGYDEAEVRFPPAEEQGT